MHASLESPTVSISKHVICVAQLQEYRAYVTPPLRSAARQCLALNLAYVTPPLRSAVRQCLELSLECVTPPLRSAARQCLTLNLECVMSHAGKVGDLF